MQFDDLLAVIWKRRLIVALVFAGCVLAASAYAFAKPKRYESTTTIAFTPDPKGGQNFIPSDNLEALLSTYAAVAKSQENLDRARRILGRPVPGEVSTSTGAGSGILEINGQAGNPEDAAATARATAEGFVASLQDNGLLVPNIVNRAVPESTPLQPRPPLIISVAILLGLIAGVMTALALERFRSTIDSSDELAEVTSLPVIGRLPKERVLARTAEDLVWDDPSLETLQESYRALRANVELLRDAKCRVLQVTSAEAGEGKSTVVANLAITLGQIGVRTAIVDADLRRPRQHDIFGVGNDVGLSTAMVLPDTPVEPQETDFPNVSLLTSGPIPANASELLHLRFRRVLRRVQSGVDIVLIDSPPVLPVSDARVIAPLAQAVIFVVGSERSRAGSIQSAVDKLRFANAHLLGAVLNLAPRDAETHSPYGYGGGTAPMAPVVEPESSPGRVPAA